MQICFSNNSPYFATKLLRLNLEIKKYLGMNYALIACRVLVSEKNFRDYSSGFVVK